MSCLEPRRPHNTTINGPIIHSFRTCDLWVAPQKCPNVTSIIERHQQIQDQEPGPEYLPAVKVLEQWCNSGSLGTHTCTHSVKLVSRSRPKISAGRAGKIRAHLDKTVAAVVMRPDTNHPTRIPCPTNSHNPHPTTHLTPRVVERMW